MINEQYRNIIKNMTVYVIVESLIINRQTYTAIMIFNYDNVSEF